MRIMTAEHRATEYRLRAAASRWDHRYDGSADLATRRILEHVRARFLDVGPACRGVDGALYQAGGYGPRSELYGMAVAMVRTRGCCELITSWDSPLAPWEWMRNRMASADGPLRAPGNGPVPRFTREEQVLAFGLRYPWELDWLAAAMSGYTFACDVRDEIFASARFISMHGGTIDARTVAAEVSGRYAWAPAWARDELGGAQAPGIARYLHRLAVTEVAPGTAGEAVAELSARRAGPGVMGMRQGAVRPRPVTVTMPRPDARPRAGPAPRM
jgi:hypothetical protein